MTEKQREKRLEKVQTKVLFQVPFFAPAVTRLPGRWLSETDYRAKFGTPPHQEATACTDGEAITFCESYFDKLEDQQLVTLICHESAHCMLGHLWRAPQTVQTRESWDSWNQACDHAVNLMLLEFAEEVKNAKLADPFPFPDPKEAFCADPAFRGLAEEVIFNRIHMQSPPGGGGGQSGSGKGKGRPAPGGGAPGPGSMPNFGQMQRPGQTAQTPAQQSNLKNQWDNTLIQSAKIAKGRGSVPAGIERLVEDLINPKVPWQEILRSWIREAAHDDWDFMKPAIEFSESEFILPSLSGEKVGRVVFATDTSGSINQKLLKQFQGEKQNCLDDMKPSSLVDIYCDARIHKVAHYSPGDTIDRRAPGGGGTSFKPVFEHCETMTPQPKALVYLTDLDGDFPDKEPGYPVLWVTWEKNGKAPFGEVVYAGDY